VSARVGREQGAPQLPDLGEIDIHPLEPAVIKPLELGRQARAETEHLSVRVMSEEVAQELIQDHTALDQAPQHVPIGFERGEIVSEARGDRFGSWIGKAVAGKKAAGERTRGKGNEQGLLDAAQARNWASGVQEDGQRPTPFLVSCGAKLRENLAAPASSCPAFARSRYSRSCTGIALASAAVRQVRTSSSRLEREVQDHLTRATGLRGWPARYGDAAQSSPYWITAMSPSGMMPTMRLPLVGTGKHPTWIYSASPRTRLDARELWYACRPAGTIRGRSPILDRKEPTRDKCVPRLLYR
jgi:hypothetical protein